MSCIIVCIAVSLAAFCTASGSLRLNYNACAVTDVERKQTVSTDRNNGARLLPTQEKEQDLIDDLMLRRICRDFAFFLQVTVLLEQR